MAAPRAHCSTHRARADDHPHRGRNPHGSAAYDGEGEPIEPTPFWRGFLGFDAHLWGEPDPSGVNPLHDFNSTIELYRELLGAIARRLGNVANVQVAINEGRWEQPTQDKRFGRKVVLPWSFAFNVADEPWIVLPFATATVPGVQVDTTIEMDFPDGSSTVVGVIVAPPP